MDELVKLKAEAYDCLANIEFFQEKLKELNNQIATLVRQEKSENLSKTEKEK